MSQRILYLAYPIDQARGDREVYRAVVAARAALDLFETSRYDPGAAFVIHDGLEPGPEIWKVNYAALSWATGMLALLPRGVPTIGTAREVQIAWQMGMPIAIVTDSPTWSLPEGERVKVFPQGVAGTGEAARWLASQEYTRGERRGPLLWTGVCSCSGGPNRDEDCPKHGRAELVDRLAPRRSYPDDAGYDLTVSTAAWIEPGDVADVHCGIAVELPPWQWGLIIGRSSTRRKRGLMVHPGVIDPGWRGELFINVENLTKEQIVITPGERVGQLILLGNQTQSTSPMKVDALSEHARGHNGFGSSGR